MDEYFAELALWFGLVWFGVSTADLASVLPDVDRFVSVGAGTTPLGFLRG
ncbi:hypothetical protein [Congregibacter sp.]